MSDNIKVIESNQTLNITVKNSDNIYINSLTENTNTTFVPLVYSVDAQTVFSRFPNDPPDYLKNALAVTVDAEVANGNLNVQTVGSSLYKQILIYTSVDTSDPDELNSLTDVSGNGFDATNVNSTPLTRVSSSHSGFAGYTPDGATRYIDDGISPNDLNLDDVWSSIWIFNNLNITSNAIAFGSSTGANDNDFFLQQRPEVGADLRYSANTDGVDSYDPGANDYLLDNSQYTIRRAGSAAHSLLVNGAQVRLDLRASSAKSIYNFYTGGLNRANTLVQPHNYRVCLRLAGVETGFDHASAYTNWLTFLQTLGIES